MGKLSMRQIAKELDISPAYLSYMINGKGPWRKDLYQRYMGVVNSFVNSGAENANRKANAPPRTAAFNVKFVPKLTGGSARESNPPTPLVTRHNGFEVAPPGSNNARMLTLFLQNRQAKGQSAETLKFYRGYLTRIIDGLGKPLLSAAKEDIAEYFRSLTCGPGGKHAYFRAIRAFYRWAEAEDLIAVIPRMVAPKVPKPLRPAVGLDDVATLLDVTESTRDKLIISLLADTGLRRAELCNVNWSEVDRERDLQDMLKRLGTQTGIKCNAHAFRRTFATESVRNGLNVFYVQSLLGHSSLTMTRIYAEQVSSGDAIKAYKPVVT